MRAALLFSVFWLACNPTVRAQDETAVKNSGECQTGGWEIIVGATSCTEAELRLNNYIAHNPSCQAALGDAGWHKLPCHGDGGKDAH